jgi:hypothetical protein
MEKLVAMLIAAELTEAACGNAGGGNLNVSQDLSDATVRAKNLQVWETFRVFYAAVVGALADTASWPVPAIPSGTLLPAMIQSLAPLVTGSGPLAGLAAQVIGFLTPRQATAKPLPSTLPNPGATPPAPPTPTATAGH